MSSILWLVPGHRSSMEKLRRLGNGTPAPRLRFSRHRFQDAALLGFLIRTARHQQAERCRVWWGWWNDRRAPPKDGRGETDRYVLQLKDRVVDGSYYRGWMDETMNCSITVRRRLRKVR
jgi:hypothetical protein